MLEKPLEHLVEFLKSGRHAIATATGLVWVVALVILAVQNPNVDNAVSAFRGWVWIAFYTASVVLVMCFGHWVWARRKFVEVMEALTPEELGVLLHFVQKDRTTLELPKDYIGVRLLVQRGFISDRLRGDWNADNGHYEIRADVLKYLKRRYPHGKF